MIYYYKAFKRNKSVPIMMSIIMMVVPITNPTSAPAITARTKMNRPFTTHIKGV
jgi:hypothetical protein